MCAWCPQRSEKGTGSPELELTESRESPYDAGNKTQVLCKRRKCC